MESGVRTNQFLAWGGLLLLGCLLLSPTMAMAQIGPQEHYDYYGRKGIAPPMLGSAEKNHLYKGIADLYQGSRNRLEYSVGEFDYILHYIPNHPQALKMVIESAFRLKRPALAQERLERAVSLYPDTASTYMIYGMFYHRNGEPDKAVGQYVKALRLELNYSEAYYNLALAYLDLQQFDKANWYAQKTYAMGSKLPGLRNRLEKAGKWNPAVDVSVLPDEIVPTSAEEKTEEKKDKSEAVVPETAEASPPMADTPIPDKR
ncbi:MAG: tetratricopeptide repeat protein [Burkholderiaceae bacterium]|nr:MAG: tetratricopeptide repeat protein [Burkholderiaceae bacterium]